MLAQRGKVRVSGRSLDAALENLESQILCVDALCELKDLPHNLGHCRPLRRRGKEGLGGEGHRLESSTHTVNACPCIGMLLELGKDGLDRPLLRKTTSAREAKGAKVRTNYVC